MRSLWAGSSACGGAEVNESLMNLDQSSQNQGRREGQIEGQLKPAQRNAGERRLCRARTTQKLV